MNYKEKLDFIKSLGWIETGEWANRTFYGLPCGKKTFGQIVEHNGDWYISNGKDDIYFIESPTNKDIEEYTKLVKQFIAVVTDEDIHTLKELNDAAKSLRSFYEKFAFTE